MKLGRVLDNDRLFRHCVYPIAFNTKTSSFANQKMWYFKPMADGAIHASLAWERYVPTLEDLHGYGCRLAAGINERKRLRQGTKYREKDRHHYCGAYQVKGKAIRALAFTPELDGIESADIVHQIEAGEIAHVDLRIVLKPGVDEEGTKTAIVDRLWNACSGPLKHTCDCDKDISVHQSSNLGPAPAGKYSDARPRFLRSWRIVRFRLFRWLWINSVPAVLSSPDPRSFSRRQWMKIKFHVCEWLWRHASRN
jgi:hypothetical protein